MVPETECSPTQIAGLSEVVLREDLDSLSRSYSVQELLSLWNQLREQEFEYMRKCAARLDRETDYRIRGGFRLARLLIAAALRRAGADVPEVTGTFSEEEYRLLEDFEEMKELDYLGIDEIVEFIGRREGRVYEMVKKYYERQYHMLDTRWKNVMGPMALAFADRYRERRAKIEEAVVKYIRRNPLTIFVEEMERVIRAMLEAREEKKRAEEAMETARRVEETLERNLAPLAQALENIASARNEEVQLLAREHERALNELERVTRELEEARRRLAEREEALQRLLSERVRGDGEREALEAEVESLRARIGELEEALRGYREAMAALEEERDRLRRELEEEKQRIREALEGVGEGHLVTWEEAWALEEAVVQRILRNLGKGTVIHDPLRGGPRSVDWDRVEHYSLDDSARPKGKGVRLVKYRGILRRRKDLVVDVVNLVHVRSYRDQGWDNEPVGLGELMEAVEERLERASGENYYHVLVVSSPTGFTSKAISYAVGEGDLMGLAARNVTLYLVDPVAGKVHYNTRDSAAAANREIAEPRLPEERVSKVVDYLRSDEARRRAMLNSASSPFLTSNEVVEALGEEHHVVRRAMALLEEQGVGRVRATESGTVAFFYNVPM